MTDKNLMNVLLAEDDKNLGAILKAYLDAKGYSTTLCINGLEALNSFKKNNYGFCVLDIMMPIKDGYTLAKEIRQIDKEVPILFLTAKSMQEDKLKGFEMGADDYLTKPFSMEELLMRMEAIIRRTSKKSQQKSESAKYSIGQYEFDCNLQQLNFKGSIQKLTSKEAELLKLLCERMNEVLDRSTALHKIWHDDSYFNARSMDVYVARIRKYLKDDPSVKLLNVHGVGFKLITHF